MGLLPNHLGNSSNNGKPPDFADVFVISAGEHPSFGGFFIV